MIKVCCVPYYRNGKFNFGDILSLVLIEQLTGQEVLPIPLGDVYNSDIVCAGSILEYIPEDYGGYIWGTGFMFRDQQIALSEAQLEAGFAFRKDFKKAKVLAVRGSLTEERVTYNGEEIELADPGILSSILKSHEVRVEYEIGIVPHYVDRWENTLSIIIEENKNSLLIDVMDNPRTVINNIARCEHIISSSLHGIIAAESLGIPATWTEFSDKVGGTGFKFRDYYSVKGDMEERKRKLAKALPFNCEILNHNAVY